MGELFHTVHQQVIRIGSDTLVRTDLQSDPCPLVAGIEISEATAVRQPAPHPGG